MKAHMGLAAVCAVGLTATALWAQVRDGVTPASFVFNGAQYAFDQSARIDTVRVSQHYQRPIDCGGICITPMQVAAKIETIGEREVIDFVTVNVVTGRGLLLDSRTSADRATGFIAGSVNVPADLLAPDNPFLPDILRAFGAIHNDGGMNFDGALPLVVFDDGPTAKDATALIEALQTAGYPDDLIRYYRGGMQVWTALGLSIESA